MNKIEQSKALIENANKLLETTGKNKLEENYAQLFVATKLLKEIGGEEIYGPDAIALIPDRDEILRLQIVDHGASQHGDFYFGLDIVPTLYNGKTGRISKFAEVRVGRIDGKGLKAFEVEEFLERYNYKDANLLMDSLGGYEVADIIEAKGKQINKSQGGQ